ncbi:MAG: hypothetical protein ABI600_10495 [Luteolibacter sp.]
MQIDAIEAALARLMPPALSEDCQFEIDAMLDELAGPEIEEVVEMPERSSRRWITGSGIAAAAAGLLVIIPFLKTTPIQTTAKVSVKTSGLVLVGESDRVESMTDEGWRDSDGSAMHAVRLNVVAENSLRDEETGIVMQVSEPREELLLTPITAF